MNEKRARARYPRVFYGVRIVSSVVVSRSTPERTVRLLLLALCLCLIPGCMNKQGDMGVRNAWRAPSLPAFEKGRSTQSDVLRALGPPSQVIGLQDQTLFYYLREQNRSKAMFLLIYNQTRQQITYDRAIFFFNKDAVLTEFSLSNEAIPLSAK
jgi:hypothetical protein